VHKCRSRLLAVGLEKAQASTTEMLIVPREGSACHSCVGFCKIFSTKIDFRFTIPDSRKICLVEEEATGVTSDGAPGRRCTGSYLYVRMNGIAVLDCETDEHVGRWDKVICVSGWRAGVTATGFGKGRSCGCDLGKGSVVIYDEIMFGSGFS
jgi:hypothetical protein